MTPAKSTAKPFIELVFASVFWGFGFVATIWCLQDLAFGAVVFYRFLIAFLVGLCIIPFLPKWRSSLLHEFKLSIGGGVLLGMTLLLQTAGLQYTTATKSAFITTLYVVIVPLIARFFLQQKFATLHWLWVLVAMTGTLLISELNLDHWNRGDTFTLLNAFTASLHILYVGKIAPRSHHHFTFNVFQSFWLMLFALCFLPLAGNWSLANLSMQSWVGLFSLSLGSSLLGFFLQIRAQKELDASVASILFLLESPMSFFFAYLLLQERLSLFQSVGAGLILIACVGASLTQKSVKKIFISV